MTHASAAPSVGTFMLNKVPEVTLLFWVVKIFSTTIGETGADFLNGDLGLGLTGTTLVAAVLLAIALFFQMRARRYVPALYWLVVVLISVTGTLITDNLTDALGVSLWTSTIVFSVILAAVFIAWFLREKTLSVHTITTRSREAFYWLAILFTFALGTAAGDLFGDELGLGFALSGLIFAAAIAVVTGAHFFFKLNAVFAFWAAYILTRPLGASFADWLSQSHKNGGLGLGTQMTSLIFLIGIVAIVIYFTISENRKNAVAKGSDLA
jgi:uncharacterized membrane-anchored protein